MKKIVFAAVLLLCVIAMNAQPSASMGARMSVEERAKKTTEWMTKELNLTPEQIAPVDSINLLYANAQQVIFQTADGDREKIRKTMEALENEKETSFAAILTTEQLNAYKKKRDEMITSRRRQ